MLNDIVTHEMNILNGAQWESVETFALLQQTIFSAFAGSVVVLLESEFFESVTSTEEVVARLLPLILATIQFTTQFVRYTG